MKETESHTSVDLSQKLPLPLHFQYVRGTTYEKAVVMMENGVPTPWTATPTIKFPDGPIITSSIDDTDPSKAVFKATSTELSEAKNLEKVLLVANGIVYAAGRFTVYDDYSSYLESLSVNNDEVELVIDLTGPKGDPGRAGTDAPIENMLAVVRHGDDESVERPTGFGAVFWIGSAKPLNSIDGDIWRETV